MNPVAMVHNLPNEKNVLKQNGEIIKTKNIVAAFNTTAFSSNGRYVKQRR